MSTEKESQSVFFLESLISKLDSMNVPEHGRGGVLSKASGYSTSYISEVLSGKKNCTSRFYKLSMDGLSQSEQPQTIAEHIGEGYSPEVKMVADILEVRIEGKNREERLKIIDDIMADIRAKFK